MTDDLKKYILKLGGTAEDIAKLNAPEHDEDYDADAIIDERREERDEFYRTSLKAEIEDSYEKRVGNERYIGTMKKFRRQLDKLATAMGIPDSKLKDDEGNPLDPEKAIPVLTTFHKKIVGEASKATNEELREEIDKFKDLWNEEKEEKVRLAEEYNQKLEAEKTAIQTERYNENRRKLISKELEGEAFNELRRLEDMEDYIDMQLTKHGFDIKIGEEGELVPVSAKDGSAAQRLDKNGLYKNATQLLTDVLTRAKAFPKHNGGSGADEVQVGEVKVGDKKINLESVSFMRDAMNEAKPK